jgi:hypothetical protein
MALIRFIVLDDEFIGDDFIGQYTIPFPCIRPGNFFLFLFGAGRLFKRLGLLTNRAWFNPKPTGYRHVRLLSNLGEALENTTLFVHVAVSEKWAGEVLDFQYFLYLYASFCF